MTLRLLFIALWAFLLRGTIDNPDRPWRIFWLILELAMVAGGIVYAVGYHQDEVEKARHYPWRR